MISDEMDGSETEETLVKTVDTSNLPDTDIQAFCCSAVSAPVPKPVLVKIHKTDDLLNSAGCCRECFQPYEPSDHSLIHLTEISEKHFLSLVELI